MKRCVANWDLLQAGEVLAVLIERAIDAGEIYSNSSFGHFVKAYREVERTNKECVIPIQDDAIGILYPSKTPDGKPLHSLFPKKAVIEKLPERS